MLQARHLRHAPHQHDIIVDAQFLAFTANPARFAYNSISCSHCNPSTICIQLNFLLSLQSQHDLHTTQFLTLTFDFSTCWVRLGACWVLFCACWVLLGACWVLLGACWVGLWCLLGAAGCLLGACWVLAGCFFCACWVLLGACWVLLGACWVRFLVLAWC